MWECVGSVLFNTSFSSPVDCIQVLHSVVRQERVSSSYSDAREYGSNLDTKYSLWGQPSAHRLRGKAGHLGSLALNTFCYSSGDDVGAHPARQCHSLRVCH